MLVWLRIQKELVARKSSKERGGLVTFEPSPQQKIISLGKGRPGIWSGFTTNKQDNLDLEILSASSSTGEMHTGFGLNPLTAMEFFDSLSYYR